MNVGPVVAYIASCKTKVMLLMRTQHRLHSHQSGAKDGDDPELAPLANLQARDDPKRQDDDEQIDDDVDDALDDAGRVGSIASGRASMRLRDGADDDDRNDERVG